MARPSVQSSRSCGEASLRNVGFESGKITGRSTPRAIARTTRSENAPACPDTPMSVVGLALFMTSSSEMRPGCPGSPGPSSFQPATASRRCVNDR